MITQTPFHRSLLQLMVVTVLGAFAIGLIVPCGSSAQSTGKPVQERQETGPTATVKVQIEREGEIPQDAKSRPDATVKVKVETEATRRPPEPPVKLLPSPEKQIAPIETDEIDKAGMQLGKKIEEIGNRASYRLGNWVNAKLFYGISWLKLAFFMLSLVTVVLAGRLLKVVMHWLLRRMFARGQNTTWRPVFVEALYDPLRLCIYVYGVYAALSLLFVHFEKPIGANSLHDLAEKAADMGGGIAVIWFCYRLVRIVDLHLNKKAASADGKADGLLNVIVGRTLRLAVAGIGGILILQNLTGIEAGPLIASLGIGGFAVALAAKEPLANIFGTFTVLFDKPFKVGDQIIIEGYNGIVESVGYRSTRILTLNGHRVSVPNQKVINATLENVKERPYIRWLTTVNLPYDSPVERLDRAVEIIEDTLANHECMSQDRPAKVCFTGFGDWSLNIMICAWYHSNDWWAYHAWLHRTCREVKLRFEAEGIDFAFPTQTVQFQQDADRGDVLRRPRDKAWSFKRIASM